MTDPQQPQTLTDVQRRALDALVPAQTGDLETDLVAAIRESIRRRRENTELGAAVIDALHESTGSWRIVGHLTGQPWHTMRKWGTAVVEADQSAAVVIACAVVVHPEGGHLLVIDRNDDSPPVAFPSAQIDPREGAAQTAARVVHEMTGLTVAPGDVIGERIHPRSGVRQLYVACTVAGEPTLTVREHHDVTGVRWATLDDTVAAFEPGGGMYPPVREWLQTTLG